MSRSDHDSAMTNGFDPVLDDVIEEVANQLQAGEPVDGAAILAKYPDRADSIRRLLPAIEVMAEFGVSASRLAASGVSPGLSPLATELGILGDFRILREVGRGGMGVVYEAEQMSLVRRVALKVLPFAAAMDPPQLRRFQTEAQAAAQLHHTNIVPVFWVGCENGVHYYAMQFIDGRTLADVIRELRRLEGKAKHRESKAREGEAPAERADDLSLESRLQAESGPAEAGTPTPPGCGSLDHDPAPRPTAGLPVPAPSSTSSTRNRAYFRNVARLGVEAAEALEHAHQEGIVHRDIKPANLMVNAKGNLWITDFGLARLQSDSGLTITGDLLGTLRYMSPEQALGRRVLIDARTDIYSLGVTLYELVTLQPAFHSRDRQELLRQIADEEPHTPRKVNSSIPRELETIILKAMTKEPAGRYQTAQEFADDLRYFLEHRPIKARRPTLVERVAKWARRHRTVVASAVVILLLAAMGLGASMVLIGRERAETVRHKDRARHHRYATDIRQAYQLAQNGQGPMALELLHRYRPAPGEEDVRSFAWYYLMRLCHGERRTLRGHKGAVYHAGFSPDGRTLVSCGQDGTVRFWDVARGRPLRTIPDPGQAGEVNSAGFSADGRTLVTASDDGGIRLWDVAKGALQATIPAHKEDAYVRFTPDGRRLLSAGRRDRLVKLWDRETHEQLKSIKASDKDIEHVVFSPDGTILATAGEDGYVRLWNLADLSVRLSFPVQRGPVYGLAFSADGTRIATGDVAGKVRVWDVSSGALRSEYQGQQHTADIQSVAFLPGDRTIVSAGGYAILKLWDAVTGQCLGSLLGHKDKIWGVSVSPDGMTIATASSDSTVKLWDPRPPQLVRTLTPCSSRDRETPIGFSYAPDGQTLTFARGVGRKVVIPSDDKASYIADADLEVSGFDPNSGMQRFHRQLALGIPTYRAVLNPGGTLVVFFFPDHTATTWEVATGTRLATIRRVDSFSWVSDPLLLVKRPSGPFELVDAATGQIGRVLPGIESSIHLASSPGGDLLALRDRDQLVIWDVTTNRVARRRPVDRPAANLAGTISPDATILAVGDSGAVIQLWDVAALELRGTLLGHSDAIRGLTFSPDGKTLVSHSKDGAVKLWDVTAGEELLTLPEPFEGTLAAGRFAPDGRTLTALTMVEDGLRVYLFPTALPAGLDSEEAP